MAVRLPVVQTFLAQKFTDFMSRRMETTVTVERVEIPFFDEVRMTGFYMEDLTGDTMIYAGSLDVDLDALSILQKKVSLSYVELNDGKFYMRRAKGEKKFNLSLFSKLFPPQEKKEDQEPFKIRVGNLRLENTNYKLIDSVNMTFLSVYVPYGKFGMKELAIEKGIIDVGNADLRKPVVKLEIFDPNRLDTIQPVLGPDTMHILPKGLEIHYTDVCMTNGFFSLRNHRGDAATKGMDFNDLEVTGIQLDVEDGGLIRDTIFADIEYLAGKEKCGMEILSLKAKTRVSTIDITLDSLLLITRESRITDFIKLSYPGFRSFGNFITDVRLEGHFDDAHISLNEINYFAKVLDPFAHNDVDISGTVSGPISNLRGKNLELGLAKQTTFKGKFSLLGLPDIKETYISFDCDELKTNYADLRKIYPDVKYPENLTSLGNVNFNGNFDGFINDFVTYGELQTGIGSIKSDINLELVDGPEKAAYSGSLALIGFDLGKWTGNTEDLGKVTFNGSLEGSGFDLEYLNANLMAEIQSLVIMGYNYENIEINGEFEQKEFTGELDIDMPDISFNFNGIADFNDSLPRFNFSAELRQAHLQNLNIMQAPIQVSAQMQVDLKGDSPDNAVSNFEMQDLRLIRELDTFQTTGIELSSDFENGKHRILLSSDFAEGQMYGDFAFKGLPESILYFLGSTEPEIFGQREKPEREQQFELDLVIFNPEELTRIIDPQFKKLRNTKIYVGFDAKERNLVAQATIHEFKFADWGLNRNQLNIYGDGNTLEGSLLVDQLTMKDSLLIDSILYEANLDNRVLDYRLQLQPKDSVNSLDLFGEIAWEGSYYSMVLATPRLLINRKLWELNPDNEIAFIQNRFAVKDFSLSHKLQQVRLQTENIKPDSIVDIDLSLSKLKLSDFSQLLL
jgi:hypothetical protein